MLLNYRYCFSNIVQKKNIKNRFFLTMTRFIIHKSNITREKNYAQANRNLQAFNIKQDFKRKSMIFSGVSIHK